MQRPAHVGKETVAANWERTFGPRCGATYYGATCALPQHHEAPWHSDGRTLEWTVGDGMIGTKHLTTTTSEDDCATDL